MSESPTLRTLSVAGTTLAYVRAGAGAPVVLVHGNLASHRYWQELLAAPPAGLELFAPDLPNFGASGPLTGEITMAAYGAALAAFLEALELRGVTLVGHSLGGAVAQACAGYAPERIARLLLVDSPAPGPFHAPEASLRGAEVLAGESDAAARRAMIAQALPAVMPTRTPPYFDELVSEAARIPPEAIMPNAYALETMDLFDLVAAYRGPVVVLRGDKDALVSDDLARATVDAYGADRCRHLTWTGVGHSPQIEAPERFTRLLADVALGRDPGGPAMT